MFLETVAKYISTQKGVPFERQCFVFPNRRSGLFFKRFLQKHSSGTTWSPAIVTINELMQQLGELDLADPLDMLFSIYDVYSGKTSLPEPFDSFYPWGEMMISDFDTLDKYLVDPVSVFRNIQELKEIDDLFGDLDEEHVAFIRKFWKSFHQGEQSREKDVFLTTWKILPEIYHEFKELLNKEGQGYEGMIYRDVAEKDIRDLSDKLTYEQYVFIGFNALSKSEKTLFLKLQSSKNAQFFWDYDKQYLSDSSMEAGRFIRENMQLFPAPVDLNIFEGLAQERQIRIFDLPSDVLQAKTVHQILSESQNSIVEANDTAIVACDENLLMPILLSLPEQVDQVNITMGYPFVNTPLNSFIESVLSLQRNARKSKTGNLSFYHKDLLSVLYHQYYKLLSDEDPSKKIKSIISENRVYVKASYFNDELGKQVFADVASVSDLCSYLDHLLHFILGKLLEDERSYHTELEKEYVLVMLGRLNKLAENTYVRDVLEKETFIRLFRKIMFNLRIPFTGEPLAGLQVMGILETRLLDFENIIMLSVNEEVMPRTSTGHSFIPHSLRYAYGLPTREEMDAIYAYYFYRVIQRAKKVDLLFKSASEGIRSGEMSRYLYQMKYDFEAKMIRPVLPVSSLEKKPIVIAKSPEVMGALNKFLHGNAEEKYLSPSSLNTYIECPLKFYFRKIINVGEQDQLLEELDAIGFGNILHQTIHELYDSLIQQNKHISAADLNILKEEDSLDKVLLANFRKEFFKSDKSRELEGRNLIIFAILKKYLLKIIETDAGLAPLELMDLEQNYKSVIEIKGKHGNIKVNIGGKIDRVDKLDNGLTRIIDYKTGNSDTSFESVASLFDQKHLRRNKEAFQAFVYASLYLEIHPDEKVQPGLYIVRKLFGKDYNPEFLMGEGRAKKVPVTIFNEQLSDFNDRMENLIGEIYNEDIPFMQTEQTEICKYCDFNSICQRS